MEAHFLLCYNFTLRMVLLSGVSYLSIISQLGALLFRKGYLAPSALPIHTLLLPVPSPSTALLTVD